MSLLHIDSFDLYSSASDLGLQYSGVGCSFAPTGGRFGGGAMQIGSYNNFLVYPVPSPQAEFWMGLAVYCTNPGGGEQPILGFRSTPGVEGAVNYAPNSASFNVRRGSYGTVLGSGSGSINSSWHWLEVHFKLHGSAGVFELWLDGQQIVNAVGVNTAGAGGSAITAIMIGTDGSNNATSGYYDDLYILNTSGATNNGRLGDCRIEATKPTGDAGPNSGAPLSGSSHYAMVNENRFDGDTSYLTVSNASGQEERFNMSSLSGTPAKVMGVKVTNAAKKTDGGSCNVQGKITSGGAIAVGPSVGLLTGYSVVGAIFETDPNTSAAWTPAAVNAAQAGFVIP
jgi:hypothetical protein